MHPSTGVMDRLPIFPFLYPALTLFTLPLELLTTAGTGNIVAKSEVARAIQIAQMILDLILVVFAVTLVLAAVSSRRTKRQKENTASTRGK